MCCFMKKWWLKIIEKISVARGTKRNDTLSKKGGVTSAERPYEKKNFIDAALDETYGPEGGEGEQWPQVKWCH